MIARPCRAARASVLESAACRCSFLILATASPVALPMRYLSSEQSDGEASSGLASGRGRRSGSQRETTRSAIRDCRRGRPDFGHGTERGKARCRFAIKIAGPSGLTDPRSAAPHDHNGSHLTTILSARQNKPGTTLQKGDL